MPLRTNCMLFFAIVFLLNALPLQSQIIDEKLTLNEVKTNWQKAGWEIPAGWAPVLKDSDAADWAENLTKVIAEQDADQFTKKMFDCKQLLRDALSGIPDGTYKKGFSAGVSSSMESNLAAVVSASDFSVRRIRNTKYGSTVLTRLLNEDGTVAYMLWRLLKNDKENIKAVDLLSLGVGEWTSHALARAATISMPKEASFLQKLSGKQIEVSKGQKQFMKMSKAHVAKNFDLVIALYDKLPEKMQKEKFIQLVRLNAAMEVSDEEYLKAIDYFKRTHPNDVASLLHSIDFFFLKEDFEKMRNAIDAIVEQVGPDSHLYNLKAVGYSSEDKHAEAIKTLKLAIATEPEREDNYWNLVESSLTVKNFDLVTATLKQLVIKFGFEEFNFESVDIYKPFLGSPQHKDFVQFLKDRTQ